MCSPLRSEVPHRPNHTPKNRVRVGPPSLTTGKVSGLRRGPESGLRSKRTLEKRTTPSPLLAAYFERRDGLKRFFQARFGASAAEADDLMQDLYLKLAEHEAAGGIANPGAYLYRLAHNLTLDRKRASQRALARDGDWRFSNHLGGLHEDVADLPPADVAVAARQKLARLITALDTLPPQTGRVFRLHKLDGLSYADTAARLGISRSAVEKHMTTALRRLLKKVGE